MKKKKHIRKMTIKEEVDRLYDFIETNTNLILEDEETFDGMDFDAIEIVVMLVIGDILHPEEGEYIENNQPRSLINKKIHERNVLVFNKANHIKNKLLEGENFETAANISKTDKHQVIFMANHRKMLEDVIGTLFDKGIDTCFGTDDVRVLPNGILYVFSEDYSHFLDHNYI